MAVVLSFQVNALQAVVKRPPGHVTQSAWGRLTPH